MLIGIIKKSRDILLIISTYINNNIFKINKWVINTIIKSGLQEIIKFKSVSIQNWFINMDEVLMIKNGNKFFFKQSYNLNIIKIF